MSLSESISRKVTEELTAAVVCGINADRENCAFLAELLQKATLTDQLDTQHQLLLKSILNKFTDSKHLVFALDLINCELGLSEEDSDTKNTETKTNPPKKHAFFHSLLANAFARASKDSEINCIRVLAQKALEVYIKVMFSLGLACKETAAQKAFVEWMNGSAFLILKETTKLLQHMLQSEPITKIKNQLDTEPQDVILTRILPLLVLCLRY